jgi:hypothetical protein
MRAPRFARLAPAFFILLAPCPDHPPALAGELEAPAATAALPTASPQAPARRKPSKKGPRLRERETEGTEAADRFEADTVIKSKYQLNGEQLEVDPD